MIRSSAQRLALASALLWMPVLGMAQEAEFGRPGPPWGGWGGGILIPLAFLLIVIVVVLGHSNHRARRRQEMLVQFLDRGREIPAELLPRPHHSRQLSLRRGVGMTCLAIGLGLACWLGTDDLRNAAWALIPLFLGIGSFINAALPDPRADSAR